MVRCRLVFSLAKKLSFTSHFLFPLWCINGYRRHNAWGDPATLLVSSAVETELSFCRVGLLWLMCDFTFSQFQIQYKISCSLEPHTCFTFLQNFRRTKGRTFDDILGKKISVRLDVDFELHGINRDSGFRI